MAAAEVRRRRGNPLFHPRLLTGPTLLVFSRQLHYTGVQSAGVVILAAALIGSGFVYSFETVLSLSGSRALELLAVLAVRSLGVLITGFIFAARSITAISAEMTLLQVTGERTTLERLGIDTRLYLLLPRVLASALGVAILDLYFIATTLLAGTVALSGRIDILAVERVISGIHPAQVFGGVIRAGVFAAVSVLWVQRFAVRGRCTFPEVPLAASAAVLQSIVLLLLLETAYQLISSQPGLP
jgi:phospholipid/cholesterol/gamma-HCH transport system permease protein